MLNKIFFSRWWCKYGRKGLPHRITTVWLQLPDLQNFQHKQTNKLRDWCLRSKDVFVLGQCHKPNLTSGHLKGLGKIPTWTKRKEKKNTTSWTMNLPCRQTKRRQLHSLDENIPFIKRYGRCDILRSLMRTLHPLPDAARAADTLHPLAASLWDQQDSGVIRSWGC